MEDVNVNVGKIEKSVKKIDRGSSGFQGKLARNKWVNEECYVKKRWCKNKNAEESKWSN